MAFCIQLLIIIHNEYFADRFEEFADGARLARATRDLQRLTVPQEAYVSLLGLAIALVHLEDYAAGVLRPFDF